MEERWMCVGGRQCHVQGVKGRRYETHCVVRCDARISRGLVALLVLFPHLDTEHLVSLACMLACTGVGRCLHIASAWLRREDSRTDL